MNGTVEPFTPLFKRSTSPRPPTVGDEGKKFHEASHRFPEPYKSYPWNMEDPHESLCGAGEAPDRPTTPADSENVVHESADGTENSSNPSPPPPFKWAQSLLCLLEDIQGVSLFQQFLKQEGQDTRSLSFWFACRGVKKTNPNDKEGLYKLINVIYDKKVKRISAISPETKEEIKRKLTHNVGVDDTIFDGAQREVEAYMMKTTYPNFLRSDIYIQHLGGWQNESSIEKECPVSPEAADVLPTVHEDSELHISSTNKMPLTKDTLWQRNKTSPAAKMKPEGPAGLYLKSPYGNYSSYHSKYASFLPASAQDSELQSLSSDAQTDDNVSLTDSSVDYPMYSRSKQKRQQKAVKHSAAINKDRLSHSTFIPRTQRLPESMNPKSPEEFHEILVKKLNKVLEEQKMKEKISERLKIIEGCDYNKSEGNALPGQRVSHKSNTAPVFDTTFFYGPSEDNVQDILDKHVSRVFEDSGQHTPAMSPGCISPPVTRPSNDLIERPRVPLRGLGTYEPPPLQDASYAASHKICQVPSYPVSSYSNRHRRDRDTHSNDSGAMFDCVSDDNLPASHRGQFSSVGNTDMLDCSQGRRSREQLKRYASKKFSSMTDSSSSCVDSGISLAYESVPPSYSKVTHWLETKRYSSDSEREQHLWKNSSTSPVLSRSSSSRKAVMYGNSRLGDVGNTPWPLNPSQPLTQDPSMPMLPPDTTSNLIEARRRLEDERAKMKLKSASGGRNSHDVLRMKFSKACDSIDDGFSHRKQSRKSCPSAIPDGCANVGSNEVTVIGYSYGRHSVPYLSKFPSKNITLRQFKSLLSKKGNFRYFFKKASNDFGTGVVFEEVTEECELLPLWEGKVFCVIESMDDNTV